MNELVFFLYRWILAPLAWLLLQLLGPLVGGKLRDFVRQKNAGTFRFAQDEASVRAGRPFWIHAASGEIEYARPVIRELKRRFPNVPVLVTYSSPSAVRMLEKLSDVDAWGPVPWEFAGAIDAFLDRFAPRALLIARTDAWPLLVDRVARSGRPSLMFAATFAENSSRLRGISRFLTMRTLSRLTETQAVSEADRRTLGVGTQGISLRVTGDTRFDQVFHRLAHPQELPAEPAPLARPIFVAGSTWPEDEAVLLPALARASAAGWRLMVAPHEVSEQHLSQLETQLSALGLTSQRFTRGGAWTQQVLLIDRVGILAELYAWGDLAFVGGSFRKQVHSVMEPLAAGLRVLVGPFHANNREALLFRSLLVDGQPCVQEVRTSEDVIRALNDERLRTGHDRLRELVRGQGGATAEVISWCERLDSNH